MKHVRDGVLWAIECGAAQPRRHDLMDVVLYCIFASMREESHGREPDHHHVWPGLVVAK